MKFSTRSVKFFIIFDPHACFENYTVKTTGYGRYRVVLSTDDKQFGGWDRISKDYEYRARKVGGVYEFPIYLPPRTAMCLVKVDSKNGQ